MCYPYADGTPPGIYRYNTLPLDAGGTICFYRNVGNSDFLELPQHVFCNTVCTCRAVGLCRLDGARAVLREHRVECR